MPSTSPPSTSTPSSNYPSLSPSTVFIVTTIAGTGTGSYSGDNSQATTAALNVPSGVALDSSGIRSYDIYHQQRNILTHSVGNVYIADYYNRRIRKVTVSTGIITTIAGTGTASYSGDNGPATSAALYEPAGVAIDSAGRFCLRLVITFLGNFKSFLPR